MTTRTLAIRQIRRGALMVAVICTGMSALVALQYQTMFAGSIDSSGLRALAENPAIRVLFGTPQALDDPGGFTVWRTGLPILLLSSVWILLSATRITRGEEEAGRWDSLLAGRIRMVDMVAGAAIALISAAGLIAIGTGVGLIAAGTDPVGAVFYGTALLGVVSSFAGAGLLSAQIMPTRAEAVTLTVAALGVWMAVRMLADGVPQLAWLAWTTPFGLAALAAPYADNRAVPLVVLVMLAAGLAAAGLFAARRRDVGFGLLTVSTGRDPRPGLLQSVVGFAIRRAIRPTVGWIIGVSCYFLLLGGLIASVLQFFDSNRRFAELAASAGFAGLDSADGFAAALFALLPIATGLYGVTRLAAMVADERAGRWTPVLSAPVSRIRLLCIETGTAAAGVVLLHIVAGLAMWFGAALTGAPFTIGAALAGALNSMPIGGLAIGAAAFAVGWLPFGVVAVGAIPGAGGFLLNVVVQSFHAPSWLVNLSPFAHLAAVPNATPDWVSIGTFVAITAAAVAVGLVGFTLRDITA
ncbi:polyketide antibiotic transporter [Mycobacteriaceae bacterium 1482268.1]|nr:polyketide antibiotic transporter [Mycobacteriaceae bacterium 1482268.1]